MCAYSPGGAICPTDYARVAAARHPALQGTKIVDCDTQLMEAPDLFTARAPARYKDKMPRHRRVKGVDRWFVGDRDLGSIGGNVIPPGHTKPLGGLTFPILGEGQPGAHEV